MLQKVRTRQEAASSESVTIQQLVLNEMKTGKHIATEGLVWLIRYSSPWSTHLTRPKADHGDLFHPSGLDFTAQALRHNIDNASKELSESFREAYGNTLKPHHSFVIKPIFSAAMSATPYRKDFYGKLGEDNAKVQTCLEQEVQALEERVAILKEFLGRKEAQWK